MQIFQIKTRKILPPQDNIDDIFENIKLKENDILCITSKIISIHQGRTKPIPETNKDELVKKESEYYFGKTYNFHLAIKHALFAPNAGIDESNGAGYFVLYPNNLDDYLKNLHKKFTKQYKIKNLGIIITDSHCTPMRLGTIGISLAHFGFEPLHNYAGQEDIFGRKIQYSRINLPDSIASSAVMMMGEGSETTPLAIARDVPFLRFTDDIISIKIKPEEDIFYPIYKNNIKSKND